MRSSTPKKMLDIKEQQDLAYAVGSQLGRGHRLSLQDAAPKTLEVHLKDHFEEYIRAGEVIKREIACAHSNYLSRMEEQVASLEPVREKPQLDVSEESHPSFFGRVETMLPSPI